MSYQKIVTTQVITQTQYLESDGPNRWVPKMQQTKPDVTVAVVNPVSQDEWDQVAAELQGNPQRMMATQQGLN